MSIISHYQYNMTILSVSSRRELVDCKDRTNDLTINDWEDETLDSLPDGLETLSVNKSRITSITSLPKTIFGLNLYKLRISVLPELSKSLRILILTGCNFKSVDFISCLENLNHLNVSYNPLKTLPTLPSKLKYLYCSFCDLESLPELPDSINTLQCEYNRINYIKRIPEGIDFLYINDNFLESLPEIPESIFYADFYNNFLLPDYYDDGYKSLPFKRNLINKDLYTMRDNNKHLLPLEKVRSIRIVKRVRAVRELLNFANRLYLNSKALLIQRVWHRYWLEPYFDPDYGYEVSRYMVRNKDKLIN